MTISSTTRIAGPFVSGTALPFTFKVFSASDLDVIRLNTTTGVETALVLNSDYTVALNGNQNTNPGGTVNLTVAASATSTVTITSDIANLQPTDLTNQGGFYPEVITDALDRATIQIQQISDINNRTIKTPISDGNLNMQLPTASNRASKYLVFDGSGLPTVSSGSGTDTSLRTDLGNNTVALAGSGIVGFRQSQATSVARTVLSKLRESTSVQDFGAVMDGVTDDTAAFNAAWTASNPNPVFVPPGSYAITGTVTGSFYSSGTVTIVGGTVNSISSYGLNATVAGDVAVNGGDITTTATGTATVFNSNATTVNIGGAATAMSIGASSGTTTVNNDLAVNGGDITTSATGTATVFNSNATTLNVGGAATTVSLGAATGTASINNATFQFNSGYGSVAPAYGCRAWVNFDAFVDTGTYSRSGNTVTCTINSHNLFTGYKQSLTFGAGTGGTATSGTYSITRTGTNTFTIQDPASGTITGSPTVTKNTIVREAGNVSSVTVNGTGDITVNFTTAMPDTNYCPQVTTGSVSSMRVGAVSERATSYMRIFLQTTGGTNSSPSGVFASVIR